MLTLQKQEFQEITTSSCSDYRKKFQTFLAHYDHQQQGNRKVRYNEGGYSMGNAEAQLHQSRSILVRAR